MLGRVSQVSAQRHTRCLKKKNYRRLHTLTEGTVPFRWTAESQGAFDKLKQVLTPAPVLGYPQYLVFSSKHQRKQHRAGRNVVAGTRWQLKSHRIYQPSPDQG